MPQLKAGLLMLAVGLTIAASFALTKAQATDLPAEMPQIITDRETKTVKIIIDGREVGRFDKDGLTITGSISYSGTLTDNQGNP